MRLNWFVGTLPFAATIVCASCSSAPPAQYSTSKADTPHPGRAMDSPTIATYPKDFPIPLGLLEGSFAIQDQCLMFQPTSSTQWYLAVVPEGSRFNDSTPANIDGVTIGGRSIRFGEKVRLGGAPSHYGNNGVALRCSNPTIVIGLLHN